jgi:ferritin-like metal-binding protein YciE
MIEHATDEKLKNTIQEHLKQTRQHAVNVEPVFTGPSRKAQRRPARWLRG